MAFYQGKYHQIKHIGGGRYIFKQFSDIEQQSQGNFFVQENTKFYSVTGNEKYRPGLNIFLIRTYF